MQEKVHAIIGRMPTNRFSTEDPALREIEDLGRRAIPVLLDYLNPVHGYVRWCSSATPPASRC